MNKKLILTICISLIIITLMGCNNTTQDKVKQPPKVEEKQSSIAKVDGQLVLSSKIPESFNPLTNMDEKLNQIFKLMYEPLIDINEKIQPVPGIAESWKINEIGTQIELKLRGDITWHDGTKVTADDVIYSLDTIRNTQNSLYSKNVRNILSYSKLDEATVRINYSKPAGDILYTLYLPVISKNHYTGKNPAEPLGNGKYKFLSYDIMKQITLELNEKYYKKAGSIKNIIIKIMPDENTELEAFKQNQINLMYSEKLNVQKYIDGKKINNYKYATLYYDFLGFNFNKAPFKDKRVRQAVAYSLNKKSIYDKNYLGFADIANTPIHPKSWLAYEPVQKYDYNKPKATKLVQDALNLGSERLSVKLIVNEENYQRVNTANVIKEELDRIGFDIKIEKSNMEDYMRKVEAGDFDLMLGGWKLAKYPNLAFMLGSTEFKNYGSYKDAQMELLLEKAFLSFNENDMKNSYKELQNHINEELPLISLFFRQNIVYASSKLKGDLKPLQWNVFNGIENCVVEAK